MLFDLPPDIVDQKAPPMRFASPPLIVARQIPETPSIVFLRPPPIVQESPCTILLLAPPPITESEKPGPDILFPRPPEMVHPLPPGAVMSLPLPPEMVHQLI